MNKFFKKLINPFWKYRARCRAFLSSSIAGLFTGVMIGIFFSLVTDVNFNRWINLRDYELLAGIIYAFFTYLVLYLLYLVGILFIWTICFFFKIKNKISERVNFKINYFASAITTLFVTPLVLLNGNLKTQLTISIIFILLYFPTMYLVVKNPKKK